MRADERYPIEVYYMTKNRCYKANRRRRPTGVQVHSVGCKGTTRDRWRKWNNATISKCASAIIDTRGIMQCLDWDVRPWLSGSGKNGNANDTHVGFEMCEPKTSEDTPEAAAYLYGCALYLCTELCRDYGIHPANIQTHCELHRLGLASNHADVNHWWGKSGTSWQYYTMDRLRREAALALGYDMTKPVEGITVSIMKKGSKGDAVRALQTALEALGFDCGGADGIYGDNTVAAVTAFQKKYGLKVDGKAGPETQTKIAALSAPKSDEPDAGTTQEPSSGMEASPLDILTARVGDLEREVAEIKAMISRNGGGGNE